MTVYVSGGLRSTCVGSADPIEDMDGVTTLLARAENLATEYNALDVK